VICHTQCFLATHHRHFVGWAGWASRLSPPKPKGGWRSDLEKFFLGGEVNTFFTCFEHISSVFAWVMERLVVNLPNFSRCARRNWIKASFDLFYRIMGYFDSPFQHKMRKMLIFNCNSRAARFFFLDLNLFLNLPPKILVCVCVGGGGRVWKEENTPNEKTNRKSQTIHVLRSFFSDG